MYKWVCLALAALFCGTVVWQLNDIRLSSKQTMEKVNVSAAIAADLAQDIKALRKLAGGGSGANQGMADYANEVMDAIAQAGPDAKIGVYSASIKSGPSLKNPVKLDEWVTGERKEALMLVFTAKSREEILRGICRNKWGSEWGIQLGNQPPQTLESWIKSKHPASKDLKLN